LLSNVDTEEQESPLQVALRWNHKLLCQYLLDRVQWNEKEIKMAIKMESLNPEYVVILKQYAKRQFSCLFNFCLCV
jgi:hypothetical protein